MEEWLRIKGFKAWWGSSEWLVNPAFFVFLYAADSMAIGEKSYYQAKVHFHAKVGGFRDSIKRKGKKE